jgi:hypothetical protein
MVGLIELGSGDERESIHYVRFTEVATAVSQARGGGGGGLMGISGKMFSISHVFSLVKITLIF